MFTELEISNFKAFGRPQKIPLRPITLVFGANSSGKSSLIHALLLAHHATETGEVNIISPMLGGDAVDLGGYRRYVYKGDDMLSTKLSFSLDIEEPSQLRTRAGNRFDSLQIAFEIGGLQQGPILTSYSVRLDERPLIKLGVGALSLNSTFLNTEHPYISEALQRVNERFFNGAAPLYKLREVTSDISDIYSYRRSLLNDFMNSSFYSMTPDEGMLTLADVKYSSLELLADLEAYELIDVLERYEDDLRSGVYTLFDVLQQSDQFNSRTVDTEKFIDDALRKGVHSREEIDAFLDGVDLATVRDVFRRANNLENTIVRELRLHTLLAQLQSNLNDDLAKLDYLGPLRTLPKRVFGTDFSQTYNSEAKGDFAWEALLRNTGLRKKVNQWLSADFLGSKYQLVGETRYGHDAVNILLREMARLIKQDLEMNLEVDIEDAIDSAWHALYNPYIEDPVSNTHDPVFNTTATELQLIDLRTSTRVSHRDVGIGISQILPVLVHAYGGSDRLVAIEQPELHLHPGLQAELGDVFIQSALGESKNRFILETHSEHLILRIMRRIRESNDERLPEGFPFIRPEDVAILYIEPSDHGALVRRIELDEEGQLIDAWPGGFFEEGFRERFS